MFSLEPLRRLSRLFLTRRVGQEILVGGVLIRVEKISCNRKVVLSFQGPRDQAILRAEVIDREFPRVICAEAACDVSPEDAQPQTGGTLGRIVAAVMAQKPRE